MLQMPVLTTTTYDYRPDTPPVNLAEQPLAHGTNDYRMQTSPAGDSRIAAFSRDVAMPAIESLDTFHQNNRALRESMDTLTGSLAGRRYRLSDVRRLRDVEDRFELQVNMAKSVSDSLVQGVQTLARG
jgi:hypothetical protein